MRPEKTEGLRAFLVRTVGLAVIVVVVWFGLFALIMVSRCSTVTTRVDQDGGPVPSWLPAEVEDLHIRGTRASLEFSGRCPQAAIEAWAIQRGIPLKKRHRGRVYVIDYGKVPLEWTSPTFRHDESIRTYLDDADEIIWERREANGGGITLHYVPSLQAFHGNRALW